MTKARTQEHTDKIAARLRERFLANQDTGLLSRMVDRYESGATLKQIAAETGKSAGTVMRWLDQAGVPRVSSGARRKGKPYEESRSFDWLAAKDLYISGSTTTQIACHFGVSPSAITACLMKQGVPMRTKHESNTLRAIGNHHISSHGYVRVNLGNEVRQYEHILVAEKALGRALQKGEVVHHINCDKTDNRPGNLLICSHRYHLQLHARMRRHPYWRAVEQSAKAQPLKFRG